MDQDNNRPPRPDRFEVVWRLLICGCAIGLVGWFAFGLCVATR